MSYLHIPKYRTKPLPDRSAPPGAAAVLTFLPGDTWTVEVTATDGRVWSGRVATEPGVTELVLE